MLFYVNNKLGTENNENTKVYEPFIFSVIKISKGGNFYLSKQEH